MPHTSATVPALAPATGAGHGHHTSMTVGRASVQAATKTPVSSVTRDGTARRSTADSLTRARAAPDQTATSGLELLRGGGGTAADEQPGDDRHSQDDAGGAERPPEADLVRDPAGDQGAGDGPQVRGHRVGGQRGAAVAVGADQVGEQGLGGGADERAADAPEHGQRQEPRQRVEPAEADGRRRGDQQAEHEEGEPAVPVDEPAAELLRDGAAEREQGQRDHPECIYKGYPRIKS